MKLNTRTLAFALALGAVAAANAQRFYLADAAGVEITGPIKVAAATGSTVTVQLWVENGAGTTYSGGGVMMGFDRATVGTATYANNAAAQAAGNKKKIALADAFSNYASGLDGYKTSDNSAASVNIGDNPLGAGAFRGAYLTTNNTTAQDRSIGRYWSWTVGTGYKFNLAANAKLRLADMVITNKGLAAGEIFGDSADENGVTLNKDANNATASTYLANGGTNSYAPATLKYQVQAVPEPGTMLAIAAGLAGLAARRRRK